MIEVLVVDDSKADRLIIERAFKKSASNLNLCFCSSATDALDYLMRKGEYADERRPSACLMDFKMPGMSGLDLLTIMKKNDNLQNIPVIMLSGSNNKEDVTACYQAGANGYIQKPQSLNDFSRLSESITSWLGEMMQYSEV